MKVGQFCFRQKSQKWYNCNQLFTSSCYAAPGGNGGAPDLRTRACQIVTRDTKRNTMQSYTLPLQQSGEGRNYSVVAVVQMVVTPRISHSIGALSPSSSLQPSYCKVTVELIQIFHACVWYALLKAYIYPTSFTNRDRVWVVKAKMSTTLNGSSRM